MLQRHLRLVFPALVTALAVACGSPVPAPTALPPLATGPLPDPLPREAARVNRNPIYTVHVRLLAEQSLSMPQPGRGSDVARSLDERKAQAYREALRRLVVRELLFEEAVDRKVTADDRAVERAYDEARRGYPDEGAWRAYLAGQGFDEQRFRNELRINHSVDALLRLEYASLPQATDGEAQDYYHRDPALFDLGERVRVSQILRRATGKMAPAARIKLRAEAEALLARIKAGEDFAELARVQSQDPVSAERGGELDPFPRGTMELAFETAAFALEPGQVSGVVESSVGFHIIKLLEKLPPRKVEYDEAREAVKGLLQRQRELQAREVLQVRLWAKARIELFL